jgi:hypothetical protein
MARPLSTFDVMGEGLHHVRFPVDDHEGKLTLLAENGYAVVIKGQTPNGTVFSYVESPTDLGRTLFVLIEHRMSQPVGSGSGQ